MSSYRTPKSGSYHLRPPSTSSPSILKKRNNAPLQNVPKHKVHINLVDNLKTLLINFNQNNEKEKLQYNNLICNIRDAGIEIKVSLYIIFIYIIYYDASIDLIIIKKLLTGYFNRICM